MFSPNSTMSRAMVATILYRLADDPSVSFAPVFTDVSADSWYANANGIVQDVGGGRFAPNADIPREQFATLLFHGKYNCVRPNAQHIRPNFSRLSIILKP